MRTLCLLVLTCFAVLGRANDYRTDPRLVKPISIHVKLVPLSTCAKEFSNATGIGIYVAPNIADRKVTVIFKNKPASEAMGMLAKTLFCDWTGEVDGYRLILPHETVNQELGMLNAEDAVLRERLAAVTKDIAAVAERPKDELTEQRDKMQRELERLRNSHEPDVKKKYDDLRKQYAQFNWLGWYEIGYALRNGPSAVEALASGSTVFASTERGQALPLPISSIPGGAVRVVVPGPDGKPISEVRSATGAVAALRCNPVTGRLQYRMMGIGFGPQGSMYTGQEAWLLDSGEAEDKLWNTPLRKRLRDWGKTLDPEVLTRKLPRTADSPKSPGYLAMALTMADHLEYLADTADVCVISDAYRQPVSGEAFMNATSVGDYVRQLRVLALPVTRGATFRTEKGWLMCRHARYWRMLSTEIPESLFAPLENKALAKEPLTLDDYTAFATALTPWQAQVFCYRPPLTRFQRLPLTRAMPALRLWGSLGVDQRNQAYTSGLPLAEMGQAQQDLYRAALNELLWIGNVNEIFLPVLMGNSAASAGIGLFLQDGRNGAQPFLGNDSETLDPPQPKMRTAADFAVINAHSYVFAFGNSPQSGASFSFEIVPGNQ